MMLANHWTTGATLDPPLYILIVALAAWALYHLYRTGDRGEARPGPKHRPRPTPGSSRHGE